MKSSGIIFDFNGVLWWDRLIQEQAWSHFAEQQFGITLTSEVMRVQVHGRNNRHTLEYLMGSNPDQDELRQLSERKERIYRDLCLAQGDQFKLSPGAVELLGALVARGIPRTIATASGEENLAFFFEHLHLSKWFDRQYIVFDDGSRPGKPAPDIYLQAAKMLRLKPTDCMVVEDSLSGLQSAQSAGIGYIVAINSGDKHPQFARLDGVDQVIDNLGDLNWKDLLINL